MLASFALYLQKLQVTDNTMHEKQSNSTGLCLLSSASDFYNGLFLFQQKIPISENQIQVYMSMISLQYREHATFFAYKNGCYNSLEREVSIVAPSVVVG